MGRRLKIFCSRKQALVVGLEQMGLLLRSNIKNPARNARAGSLEKTHSSLLFSTLLYTDTGAGYGQALWAGVMGRRCARVSERLIFYSLVVGLIVSFVSPVQPHC